jgi:hypothetical protein
MAHLSHLQNCPYEMQSQETISARAKRLRKNSGFRAKLVKIFAGAKQAAEKGLKSGEILEIHPAGAKAQPLLSCICGPTEVVPCYKTGLLSSFSAACKARH